MRPAYLTTAIVDDDINGKADSESSFTQDQGNFDFITCIPSSVS